MWGNERQSPREKIASRVRPRDLDDSAVSPIIGIILMLSITIILAAVAGVFVTNVDTAEKRPQLRFAFEFEDNGDSEVDRLRVIHEGGPPVGACEDEGPPGEPGGVDCVDHGELYIVPTQGIEDDTGANGAECAAGEQCPFGFDDNAARIPGERMTAGEDFTLVAVDPEDNLETATVRIVWIDAESGQSATVATWEGPKS
jgi:flagellin-like protein